MISMKNLAILGLVTIWTLQPYTLGSLAKNLKNIDEKNNLLFLNMVFQSIVITLVLLGIYANSYVKLDKIKEIFLENPVRISLYNLFSLLQIIFFYIIITLHNPNVISLIVSPLVVISTFIIGTMFFGDDFTIVRTIGAILISGGLYLITN